MKTQQSIATLFFLFYGIFVLILGACFGLLIYMNQMDLIVDATMASGTEAGIVLRESAETALNKGTSVESLAQLLKETKRNIKDVKISERNGTVLSPRADELSQHERRNIHTAITKQDFQNSLFHQLLNSEARELEVYIPLYDFILIARIDMPQMDAYLERLANQTMLVLLLLFAFSVTFLLFISFKLIYPIRKLQKGAVRLSTGEYDLQLEHKAEDELGILARTLVKASESIKLMEKNARAANPLSGLPGNVNIELEVKKRLIDNKQFCVLYADLDNFKAYNDIYGFKQGDLIILFARDVLVEATKTLSPADHFLGHQGGDDFVAITEPGSWEACCKRAIEKFNEGIKEYYTVEDYSRGFIMAKSRSGSTEKYPLVSLSIAAVSNSNVIDFAQIAQRAAEVKHFLKDKGGNAYAIDKRSK